MFALSGWMQIGVIYIISRFWYFVRRIPTLRLSRFSDIKANRRLVTANRGQFQERDAKVFIVSKNIISTY